MGRNLKTLVPHTGQVPVAAFLLFLVVTSLALAIFRLALHFTQNAWISTLNTPFRFGFPFQP